MARSFYLAAGVAVCMVMVTGISGSAAAEDANTDTATPIPGVIAAFITAGAADPNRKVPKLNAVAGAGVTNIAISSPLGILQHGGFYTILLASQNVTFKGTCTDSYVLQRGKKILAHGTIHTYACAAGSYWEWAINTPAIPNSLGLATLVGTVAFGGNKVTTSAKVVIK
jgi:hypothetical protein